LAGPRHDCERAPPSGLLARVWQRLDADEATCGLADLAVRGDLVFDPALALGRRWRHDRPDFWARLSPLGRVLEAEPPVDLRPSEIAGFMDDSEPEKEGSWR